MTTASRFKKTYQAVRNANWLWAMIAVVFFLFAITSMSSHGKQPSLIGFMFWSAACAGIVISIRRNKARY